MKKFIALLLALALIAALPLGAAAYDFSDWDGDAWYADAMGFCVDETLFSGSGGQIEAGRAITRAEFLAVLVRYFGFTEMGDVSAFGDVSERDWFYEYVSIGLAAGITKGTGTATFSPYASISREEAFTMFIRALQLDPVDTDAVLASVPDADSISSWARDAVAIAIENGIVTGYEDGSVLPKGSFSRAEAAAIVYRATETLFGGEVPARTVDIAPVDVPLAELPEELAGTGGDDGYYEPLPNESTGGRRFAVDTELRALVGGNSARCGIRSVVTGATVTLYLADGGARLGQITLDAGEYAAVFPIDAMPGFGNHAVYFEIVPEAGLTLRVEATLYVAYLWG